MARPQPLASKGTARVACLWCRQLVTGRWCFAELLEDRWTILFVAPGKILEKIRFTSGFLKFGIWNSISSVLIQTAIASRSHNNGFRSFERFTRGLSSQNWDQIICCDTFAQTVFFAYFVCSCEPFRFSSQHVKPKLSNWTTNNIENQS